MGARLRAAAALVAILILTLLHAGEPQSPFSSSESKSAVSRSQGGKSVCNSTRNNTQHDAPQCRWKCKEPVCPPVCRPHCERPRCQMKCQPLKCAKCVVSCQTPRCSVRCPKRMCEKDHCPPCQTICTPTACKTICLPKRPICAPVCEPVSCEWKCAKPPLCPKPKCELECERPHCSSGRICPCECDTAANVKAAIKRANKGLAAYEHIYVETVPNKDTQPFPTFVEVMSSMLHKRQNGWTTCCPCSDFDSHFV